MTKKENVELIIAIVNSLTFHYQRWGCLSGKGVLFQINTFERIQVPSRIVNMLVKDKIIVLDETGVALKENYYKLNQ